MISRSENEYTKTEFLAPGTTNPISTTNSNNILWGAAAAAAVGAFMAEAQRKREEEVAAKAAADRAAFLARIEKEGAKKGNRILSYKQRAKAYQASLDNFKASLIKSGLTPEEAAAAKTKALLGGSIPSVASVVAAKNRNDAMEAKMAAEDAADEAKWIAMKQAEEAKKAELQTGLAAYYNAMRQGEQDAQQAQQMAGLAAYYNAMRQGERESPATKEQNSGLLSEAKKKVFDSLIAIRQFGILSKISYGDNKHGNKTIIANVPDGEKLSFRQYLSDNFGLDLFGTGNVKSSTINNSIMDAVFDTNGKGFLNGFVDGVKNTVLDFGRNIETFRNKVGELGGSILNDIRSKISTSNPNKNSDEIVEATAEVAVREGAQSTTKTVLKEVAENAAKSGPLDLITTVGFNLYDYGYGDEKDKGIGSQEFWVSTGVDLAQSLVAALAAAALVAAGIAAIAIFFPAVVVAAPVALAITAVVAATIDIGLNMSGANQFIKDGINNYLDS